MNFTEVLFAVMILGIGFIMVAAIFPVAIQQSRSNTDETDGAVIAKTMFDVIKQHADDTTLPPTATNIVRPVTIGSPLWSRLVGDFIFHADHRYGSTVLFRRQGQDPFAQVIVIPIRINVRSEFVPQDLMMVTGTPGKRPAFEPISVWVKTAEGNSGPDTIQFYDGGGTTAAPADVIAAAEGAYVVIGDDQLEDDPSTSRTEKAGDLNGRIYRLGRPRPDIGIGVWELMPGSDMPYARGNEADPTDDVHENIPAREVGTVPATSSKAAVAYLIGRGVTDPTSDSPTFAGANQAVGVYTTLIPIKPAP